MMMRDYQVGTVNRRLRGWIALTVVAVVLLAISLVAAGLSQIGGSIASASTPITMETAVAAAQGKIAAPDVDEGAPGPFKVNLNTADASQLEQVPGLGKVKVKAILAWRTIHPFQVPADVMKVKGIGPGSYEKLKGWLAVDGPPLSGTPPKGHSPRSRTRNS